MAGLYRTVVPVELHLSLASRIQLCLMPSWDFSQAYRKQLDLFKRNRESKVMIQFRDVAPDALLRGGARSAPEN